MKKFIVFVLMVLVMMTNINVLASTEENESSDIPLEIETYLNGKNQPTHPSIVSFEKEWNGYKYWMTYTPYPYGNGEEENPCIAVSNDMLKWITPKGLANPIANNEELGCNELKDSHILYRDDLDRIEVWYLGRISENISLGKYDPTQLTLFRKYSYNGVDWSDFEIMNEVDYLSPSIIWKDNKYMMWQIGFDTYDTDGTIQYLESKDGFTWENCQNLSLNGNNSSIEIWHGSVTYNKDINCYEMVYIEDGNDNDCILYTKSENGIDFDEPITILKISNKWNRFYRPFLFRENQYYLVYGVITSNNEWYISMNYGDSIDLLNQLNENDSNKMIGLNYPELNKSIVTLFKECLSEAKQYIRFEIYCIPFILYLAYHVCFRFDENHKTILALIGSTITILYCLFEFSFCISLPIIVAIIFMILTQYLMLLGLFNFKK